MLTSHDVEVLTITQGEQLREQREKLNLTQKQVAERAKITERQYQTFEGDERSLMTCSFRTAGKILNALELDIASYHHGSLVHTEFVEVTEEEPASAQLKARREALDLTQKEVATRADIVLQQYQKYEGGQRDLRNGIFQTACKVIEALELDITDFSRGKVTHVSHGPDEKIVTSNGQFLA